MSNQPLLVFTPWYPTAHQINAGSFVRDWVRAAKAPGQTAVIVHLEHVYEPADYESQRTQTPEGEVLHIPVLAPIDTPRAQMSQLVAQALQKVDLPELATASEVHAHVGMPCGWAVSQILRSRARLTLVEHASYLPVLLTRTDTKPLYGALLDRAERVFTAGPQLAQMLEQTFPQHRAKIMVSGNPIDFSRLKTRLAVQQDPHKLNRWLTLGNLVPLKRVDQAIRAFANWVQPRPEATLTIAGDGPQRQELEQLARELGVAQQVTFRGAVPHHEVPQLLEHHDVLIHLSQRETFGIAPVEAAASGLAVVVTTCGGPEDSLATAELAGLVRFVPHTGFVENVCNAVRVLEATAGLAPIGQIRADLEQRFSTTHFYCGLTQPAAQCAAEDGTRFLAVAHSRGAWAEVVRPITALAAHGMEVTIVTSLTEVIRSAPASSTILDQRALRLWLPWNLLWWLLVALPGRVVLALAKAGFQVMSLFPGPLGRIGAAGTGRLRSVITRWSQVQDALFYRIGGKYLRILFEPTIFARRAERKFGRLFTRTAFTVVASDGFAIPTIWRILRRNSASSVAITGREVAQVIFAQQPEETGV